jgi:hypothetical protein
MRYAKRGRYIDNDCSTQEKTVFAILGGVLGGIQSRQYIVGAVPNYVIPVLIYLLAKRALTAELSNKQRVSYFWAVFSFLFLFFFPSCSFFPHCDVTVIKTCLIPIA